MYILTHTLLLSLTTMIKSSIAVVVLSVKSDVKILIIKDAEK